MLTNRQGHVTFVDWAHACAGPTWLDLVLWLPALQLEGGGTPDAVLARAYESMGYPLGWTEYQMLGCSSTRDRLDKHRVTTSTGSATHGAVTSGNIGSWWMQ